MFTNVVVKKWQTITNTELFLPLGVGEAQSMRQTRNGDRWMGSVPFLRLQNVFASDVQFRS